MAPLGIWDLKSHFLDTNETQKIPNRNRSFLNFVGAPLGYPLATPWLAPARLFTPDLCSELLSRLPDLDFLLA